ASLSAHPKRGWLTGPTKAYEFTVTVSPQGARGDVKTVNGSFVHRPMMPSWGPVFGVLRTIIVLILLAAGVTYAYRLGGGVSGYQMGFSKLAQQARGLFAGDSTPGTTAVVPPGTANANERPVYTEGFRLMHDAEPALVGDPTENVSYDRVGNGYQNSAKGTLFWLKATNTVYFFTTEAAYVFRNGRANLIDKTAR
ncbi:MAG: hypothetical protein M1570_00225, partial [Chloroflexi bacterium]|nr:hypothetical protein [Chloroflexota bacterium]